MLLIRHGKSEHNVSMVGRFDMGDPGLHRDGLVQSHELAYFLADRGGLDVIVSSPADRAVTTASILCDVIGAELVVRGEAREFDWGAWGGVATKAAFTDEEQKRADDEAWDYRANDYAETMNEAHHRFNSMVVDVSEQYDGQSIGIVSHSFASKCYVGGELGMSRLEVKKYEFTNCQVLAFDPQAPAPPIELFRPTQQ